MPRQCGCRGPRRRSSTDVAPPSEADAGARNTSDSQRVRQRVQAAMALRRLSDACCISRAPASLFGRSARTVPRTNGGGSCDWRSARQRRRAPFSAPGNSQDLKTCVQLPVGCRTGQLGPVALTCRSRSLRMPFQRFLDDAPSTRSSLGCRRTLSSAAVLRAASATS